MTVTEKTWQLHKPKGEWRLCGSGLTAEIREDGRTIAFAGGFSSDAKTDNRLALMAAAPELLEACQSVKAWMEDCLMDSGVSGLPSRVQYDAVCAAIAKAGV